MLIQSIFFNPSSTLIPNTFSTTALVAYILSTGINLTFLCEFRVKIGAQRFSFGRTNKAKALYSIFDKAKALYSIFDKAKAFIIHHSPFIIHLRINDP
jgi:hypothetical protein